MTVECLLHTMTTEYNLDQLNDIGSDVDLSEVPPINQKRMLAFINEFLINTISLLNDFYQNCEYRLQNFDLKMQKLEAELCILESKLKSIPGLEVDIPKPAVTTELSQPQTEMEPVTVNLNLELDVTDSSSAPPKDVGGELETPEVTSKPPNPELEKYYRMLRFGVPMDAVKVEMQIDGCDPKLLDST